MTKLFLSRIGDENDYSIKKYYDGVLKNNQACGS
ncbi:hypothetical protein C825_001808 [Parabacteroides sp. ASF519]|jgi:hypothetical protein|uniref:Uncharacterized protein n=1 Tax=Parabacteroides goldsteinii dnLKV18 TaxID=1235789 RepID=S0GIC2_9BACT|nr:hypothetical protein C803_02598 [Parabacteroides goldsteinii dnLKV18]KAI4359761.1 hypothetical protein C825_001808 [Parabacteroides sp. ASF519]